MGPQPGDYEDGMDDESEDDEDDGDHPVEPPALAPEKSVFELGTTRAPATGTAGGKGKSGGKTGPTFDKPRDPPSKEEFDENGDGWVGDMG